MAAARRAVAPVRSVRDDEVVSNIVGRSSQRNALRSHETGISVVLGKHSPSEAVALAFGRPVAPGDGVRHAPVGVLRSLGFSVEHSPSRMNPLHGVVKSADTWDDNAFASCFDEPIWEVQQ